MNRRQILLMLTSQTGMLWLAVNGFAGQNKKNGAAMTTSGKIKVYSAEQGDFILVDKVHRSKEEWKQLLTSEQYHVLREAGTERAFTGKLLKTNNMGSTAVPPAATISTFLTANLIREPAGQVTTKPLLTRMS